MLKRLKLFNDDDVVVVAVVKNIKPKERKARKNEVITFFI